MYPGTVQCYNCWCWKHPTHAYHTQDAKYWKGSSLHRVENHRLLALYYKTNLKSDSSREATIGAIAC